MKVSLKRGFQLVGDGAGRRESRTRGYCYKGRTQCFHGGRVLCCEKTLVQERDARGIKNSGGGLLGRGSRFETSGE